jgi:raffinose/stachyose/melibiose transport system permease protein
VTTVPHDSPAPGDGARSKRGGFLRRRSRGGPRQVPWILALPAVAFLVAFHFIPGVAGGWYAFTDWNGITAHANYVGLRNFREIFHSADARGALFHTLELAGSFVVLVNLIGLILALGLNRGVKSRNVLRALFFAPVIVSPLAVSYIFQYVFDYAGPFNRLLGGVGLDNWQRPWLGDPTWALWTILVVLVWQFCGLTMVIYLAGLQGIPQELDEATAVDGATLWTRFRRVTFPLLAPAITVNVTLTLIFGLRLFDQVLGMTGGGPVNATETLATQVYKQTFAYGRFGYGAALALILAALISVMAISQALILRARETR